MSAWMQQPTNSAYWDRFSRAARGIVMSSALMPTHVGGGGKAKASTVAKEEKKERVVMAKWAAMAATLGRARCKATAWEDFRALHVSFDTFALRVMFCKWAKGVEVAVAEAEKEKEMSKARAPQRRQAVISAKPDMDKKLKAERAEKKREIDKELKQVTRRLAATTATAVSCHFHCCSAAAA
jgi:hypothetical protein